MGIHEASGEHIEAIRRIAEASWNHDYPDILSRETVAEGFEEWYGGDRLETEIRSPKSAVLVSEDREGGTVTGFIHALVDGDEGVILRLYVHPDHRRQGVGRALFEGATTRLREFDVECIRAMVLAENAPGNEFYRRLGFEKVSEEVTTIGGEAFEENVYELTEG